MKTEIVSQERWIKELQTHSATLENPTHRDMIATLIEYLRAGPLFDSDRFMGTMDKEVYFRRFGVQRGRADRDKIQHNYSKAVSARVWPLYEVQMERLCFSLDCLAFDGVFRQFATLKDVFAHGHVRPDMLPDGVKEEDKLLVSRRLATFLTFKDGKITVEDTYWDEVSIEILGEEA